MSQSATEDTAVQRQVEEFIARFTPEIAQRARDCRAAIRQRLPTANELVYDNYNALAIGYAPTERASDVIISLAIYPRNVLLYFLHGKALPDPNRLLKGEGKRGGYVCLFGPDTLDEPGVSTLLATALDAAARPLPESGSGRTIVKSISVKQRPRRPAKQEPA